MILNPGIRYQGQIATSRTQADYVGSQAVPYSEQDRSARGQAIFEGTAGLIRSAADVYRELRADPRQLGDGSLPPPGTGYAKTSFSLTNPATLIVLAGIVVLAFVMIRK